MRAALVAGGLVVAGCLGAYGAVEAQKYPLAATLWSTVSNTVSNVVGARTATTGSAETAAARPQSARPVTTTATSPVQVAAAPGAPAPAAQATPAPQAAPAQARSPMPKPAPIACNNPNALGISRVVQIDTTGGPGFGMEHFRTHDFLNDHEVVLTFDDGPWLNHTPMVLKALADQCVRATFFPIGKHATYYPEILKQVAAAGHTVGSHTWSHKDLSKVSADEAKTEIELGVSAVHAAVGSATAPFFRFPALKHPPEMVTYLGDRNVAIFSADFDSFDFKMHKPEQVVKSVMEKLAKHGKGIILMHDFQKATAEALPTILAKLKEGGYKVVHMVPQDQMDTLPQYDEQLRKDQKLPTVDQRPTSSVVRTINE